MLPDIRRLALLALAIPLSGIPAAAAVTDPAATAAEPAAAPAAELPYARLLLRSERFGIAQVDLLDLTRLGNYARVHRLRMRIPREALVRFLAEAIAGGPVTDLAVEPLGPNRLALGARAFGWPTQAVLTLSARHGRAHVGIESARFGWFPVSPTFLRDQIVASSEPDLVRSGEIRPDGAAGLSFAPDYLFSHLVARLPEELARRGLPPHLDVRLTRIALRGGSVQVEGGD